MPLPIDRNKAALRFSPRRQHEIYLQYLVMKVAVRDWHGVADAAMDLRELEAAHLELKEQK